VRGAPGLNITTIPPANLAEKQSIRYNGLNFISAQFLSAGLKNFPVIAVTARLKSTSSASFGFANSLLHVSAKPIPISKVDFLSDLWIEKHKFLLGLTSCYYYSYEKNKAQESVYDKNGKENHCIFQNSFVH
jgi:hypothetical protein